MFLRPKFLLFALVAALAAACGLKGPLYRADQPQDQSVTPTDDSATSAKKKQTESAVQPPDPDRPAVPPQN
jgi:predicted small lipoprotein YifL